jgi:UDP-N-acetylglucosamine/UDP-N-acetylgalactosamine diphosphorylase
MLRDQLLERLRRFSQEHVLRWWTELSVDQQASLAEQLHGLDLEWLERQRAAHDRTSEDTPARQAERARPPAELVRLPRSPQDRAAWARAARTGEAALREGRVGVILVAGGEATRLGFEHPKGMYPIGPISGKTLFQLLAEQARARGRRANVSIPYYVMTSSATHDATIDYFRKHEFLGFDPNDVYFFRQGNLPAVDRESGRLLMASKHALALNPDGHGGLLGALVRAGLLDDMRRRGIDTLYYHQVDNPLAKVCEPAFLGFHIERGAEVSTKVVSKLAAEEKLGLLVDVDGISRIIEYSDMPAEIAARQEADGSLRFWAGSTAIHVFSRSLFERLVEARIELPVHRAIKKVPHLDAHGGAVQPAVENAVKYERFIFDVLPLAAKSLVVEAAREDEFCPLKNKTGEFSPEHVRQSLSRMHARWLRAAGVDMPDDLPVEISPLYALDADELVAKGHGQSDLQTPIHLE